MALCLKSRMVGDESWIIDVTRRLHSESVVERNGDFYDSRSLSCQRGHQAGGIVFRGAHKPSRMRRGADTGGSTLWPVGLSDRYEARATFPSKVQQQNPPHCKSGSLIASNRHLNVKQPVACQMVGAQYILTISSISKLKQDSLGSTRSQAGRHR